VWDSRSRGRGVFQARYGFSKVSSVSWWEKGMSQLKINNIHVNQQMRN
jgi:hypothetical protein